MEGSERAESDAAMIASLRAELAMFGVRELELELRIAELERHRWRAFSLVELEWMTNAFVDAADDGTTGGDQLPAEADAELARRARPEHEFDLDADEDPDPR